MSDNPRVLLVLEALPWDVPADIRLRRAMKVLAGYGFRCRSAEDVVDELERRAEELGRRHARHARQDSG